MCLFNCSYVYLIVHMYVWLFMSVRLFICLFNSSYVCSNVHVSAQLLICLFNCSYVCSSVYLFVRLFMCLFDYSYVCSTVNLSVQLLIICLLTFLFNSSSFSSIIQVSLSVFHLPVQLFTCLFNCPLPSHGSCSFYAKMCQRPHWSILTNII